MSTFNLSLSIFRFWKILEKIPSPSLSMLEWRTILGKGFDLTILPLLPTGRQVGEIDAYSSSSKMFRRFRVTVFDKDTDDIVGTHDETDEQRSFTWAEIQSYALNRRRLRESIALAMRLVVCADPPSPGRQLTVGHLEPIAGCQAPAIMILSSSTVEFQKELRTVLLEQPSLVLLLAPTDRFWSQPSTQQIVDRSGRVRFLPLDKSVEIAADGIWRLTSFGMKALEEVRQKLVPPSEDEREPVVFSTPRGATWKDVKITFRDGHTVSVNVQGAVGLFSYSQLGFEDRRKRAPCLHWNMLRKIAKNEGLLTHRGRTAPSKLRQQKRHIANLLKRFFSLTQDPFLKVVGGWSAEFRIIPDSDNIDGA